MDDVFQVIIWLFVIGTFIRSIFKAKKQEPPKPPVKKPTYRTEDGYVKTIPPRNEEQYDILKEIENMFNTEVKTQPKTTYDRSMTSSEHVSTESERSASEYTSYEVSRKQSEIKKRESEHEATSSEHTIPDYSRKTTSISKETESKAKILENLLAERNKKTNETVKNLRAKLKTRQSVRDAIILSEIIGKPKSLS